MKLHKYFLGLIAAIVMANGATVLAAGQIDIFIDGDALYTDVPPTIINNRTMLPVAAVSEAVGCQVEWDSKTREVTVIFPSQSGKMVMQINNTTVRKMTEDINTGWVEEETITIDSPPVILNNRTLVPLAFIAETLGFRVEWDGATRTVYLYSALYEPNGGVPAWNGLDLGPNLTYSEEYTMQGDPGEYLSTIEAAELTFYTMLNNGNIPGGSDNYNMALVDLAYIEGEECYVYRLDVDESSGAVGAAYAYAYQSGNIYMEGYGGQWVFVA
ncbi:MAG: copper amine oxidase N-terminal domain-containing protein [Clostridiales bacterium]|jgi:hypothetical protein|nr:copper amine oxidase N-terminal domain-containing protein [Clostridiales bacterium]